jgi:phenylalanyl-tRNA synthetase alpha subunit
MTEQAAQIQTDALAAIDAASSEAALEEARVKFLGKKSPLNALAAEMRNLPTKTNQNSGLL